jgi:hypothetical protein
MKNTVKLIIMIFIAMKATTALAKSETFYHSGSAGIERIEATLYSNRNQTEEKSEPEYIKLTILATHDTQVYDYALRLADDGQTLVIDTLSLSADRKPKSGPSVAVLVNLEYYWLPPTKTYDQQGNPVSLFKFGIKTQKIFSIGKYKVSANFTLLNQNSVPYLKVEDVKVIEPEIPAIDDTIYPSPMLQDLQDHVNSFLQSANFTSQGGSYFVATAGYRNGEIVMALKAKTGGSGVLDQPLTLEALRISIKRAAKAKGFFLEDQNIFVVQTF